MAPRRKIIIDTDPGVDDILAILLAFSATSEELDVLLLSLTYGNVEVDKCLRNVISLLYHVHQEMRWRQQNGKAPGFEALSASKPIVAIGAENPLADAMLMADYFHGTDGLGGISESHPHLTPDETWQALSKQVSKSNKPEDAAARSELSDKDQLFRPSKIPAHKEILRLLKENAQDEITIVAVGPMTNLALAAAEDPVTFLRTKEVVIMGGAVSVPGNITPVAEFNTFADSYAAARLYALSSPLPASTMPPTPPTPQGKRTVFPPPPHLSPYPRSLPKQLPITLFPLDITHVHNLTRTTFTNTVTPLISAGSPLAKWIDAFISSTFRKVESLRSADTTSELSLEMHDPLCIWYVLTGHRPGWKVLHAEDLRVETSGQWTRGMCVVDGRDRKKADEGMAQAGKEIKGDHGGWLSNQRGNRVDRAVASPDAEGFAGEMLGRIFGL
ncbi:putative nucleoside hydrolase [Elsinoe ampelina]|uniref:Putative nucleoside hydrolase n=1 Tax=Elsinoe ampelina TaxID=302913 RepID=A0A6A6G633_9PEZI|nr:putative nucleoside hydrolase [Elsinoe ampelina]